MQTVETYRNERVLDISSALSSDFTGRGGRGVDGGGFAGGTIPGGIGQDISSMFPKPELRTLICLRCCLARLYDRGTGGRALSRYMIRCRPSDSGATIGLDDCELPGPSSSSSSSSSLLMENLDCCSTSAVTGRAASGSAGSGGGVYSSLRRRSVTSWVS